MELIIGIVCDIFDMVLDAVFDPVFDKRITKLKNFFEVFICRISN